MALPIDAKPLDAPDDMPAIEFFKPLVSDLAVFNADWNPAVLSVSSAVSLAIWQRWSTPFSPPSGLATGSLNGLNPKSKFLAFRDAASRLNLGTAAARHPYHLERRERRTRNRRGSAHRK